MVEPNVAKEAAENEKRKCPVYGYAFREKLNRLNDQGNDICPLLSSSSECQMEAKDEIPDWKKCALRIEKETLNGGLAQICGARVFPMQFIDKEYNGGWKGLSFEVWKNYILEGIPIPEEYSG